MTKVKIHLRNGTVLKISMPTAQANDLLNTIDFKKHKGLKFESGGRVVNAIQVQSIAHIEVV